jgi:hypothetical protein
VLYYIAIVSKYVTVAVTDRSIVTALQSVIGNLHNSTVELLNVTVTICALVALQVLVLVKMTVKS